MKRILFLILLPILAHSQVSYLLNVRVNDSSYFDTVFYNAIKHTTSDYNGTQFILGVKGTNLHCDTLVYKDSGIVSNNPIKYAGVTHLKDVYVTGNYYADSIFAKSYVDNLGLPFDTTNLNLWFEADYDTILDGSNNLVTWGDRSPKNNDATAGVGNEPAAVNNYLNGHPAIQFGAGDYIDFAQFHCLNNHTWFFVYYSSINNLCSFTSVAYASDNWCAPYYQSYSSSGAYVSVGYMTYNINTIVELQERTSDVTTIQDGGTPTVNSTGYAITPYASRIAFTDYLMVAIEFGDDGDHTDCYNYLKAKYLP